jgi:protein-disulfide isomerase
MRLLSILTAAAAGLLLTACQPSKADMDARMQAYLMENPQVIVDALNQLQDRETAATRAQETALSDTLWRTTLAPQLAQPIVDPHLGPDNAPITIVEYTDYNCPYCRAANAWVMTQLDNPRRDVRVIFKEMPIPSIPGHETSPGAAHAAIAAHMQGKYREMHEGLMKLPGQVTPQITERLAQQIGLDLTKWRTDMNSPAVQQHMDRAQAEADSAQIRGTPTFFVNGRSLRGYSEQMLNEMIEQARNDLAANRTAGSR